MPPQRLDVVSDLEPSDWTLRTSALPQGSLSAARTELPSVLKRDDRVDFVHVVRSVPEHSGEVVGIRRVVHLDFVAESSVFGKGVNFSFVVDDLQENKRYRGNCFTPCNYTNY